MAGILIVDQIQNSSNTVLINSGALAANTVTNTQIAANTIVASNFQTNAIESYLNTQGNTFGFRNRLINGAMQVWQRGTSSISGNSFAADRWTCPWGTGASQIQSTDTPNNSFQYSTLISGSDYLTIGQRIEAVHCKDLVGQSVTISFWMKQTVGAGSGSIGIQLYSPNASDYYTGGQTLITGASTSLNGSSSWTQYSVTFNNITTAALNGIGLQIYANIAGSSTFYITGVQLEKGTQATPFEYRPITTELALCQRYFYQINAVNAYSAVSMGDWFSGTRMLSALTVPTPMRSAPVLTNSGFVSWYGPNPYGAPTSISMSNSSGNSNGIVFLELDMSTTGATATAGGSGMFKSNNSTSSYLKLDAEIY